MTITLLGGHWWANPALTEQTDDPRRNVTTDPCTIEQMRWLAAHSTPNTSMVRPEYRAGFLTPNGTFTRYAAACADLPADPATPTDQLDGKQQEVRAVLLAGTEPNKPSGGYLCCLDTDGHVISVRGVQASRLVIGQLSMLGQIDDATAKALAQDAWDGQLRLADGETDLTRYGVSEPAPVAPSTSAPLQPMVMASPDAAKALIDAVADAHDRIDVLTDKVKAETTLPTPTGAITVVAAVARQASETNANTVQLAAHATRLKKLETAAEAAGGKVVPDAEHGAAVLWALARKVPLRDWLILAGVVVLVIFAAKHW